MKFFGLLVLVCLTVACGPGITTGNSSDFASTGSDLFGTWGKCRPISGDPMYASFKPELILNSNSGKNVIGVFSDGNCVTEVARYVATISLAIVGPDDSGSGYKVNTTILSMTLTPKTTAVANDYNSRSLCGFSSGWAANTTRDKGSGECILVVAALWLTGGSSVGDLGYGLMKADYSTTPALLYLGESTATLTGDSEATRPVTYDSVSYYPKQ